MRTKEDLIQLAKDKKEGKLFTSEQCSPYLLPAIFMPIPLLKEGELDKMTNEGVPLIFEYLESSVGAIEGFPQFGSFQWLTREEFVLYQEALSVLLESEKETIARSKNE